MSDYTIFDPDLALPDPNANDADESAAEVEATTTRADQADTVPGQPVIEEKSEDHSEERAYPDAGAWVEDWLLPRFRHELGGSKRRWDPEWWHYEEVVGALEALWQAWEQLRLQPGTGNAVFYHDYLYPIMDQLTAPDGPFWNLHQSNLSVPDNTVPPTWETAEAPQGSFREENDHREN